MIETDETEGYLPDPDVKISLRNGVITLAVVERKDRSSIRASVKMTIDDTETLIKRLETLCDKAIQEEKEPSN